MTQPTRPITTPPSQQARVGTLPHGPHGHRWGFGFGFVACLRQVSRRRWPMSLSSAQVLSGPASGLLCGAELTSWSMTVMHRPSNRPSRVALGVCGTAGNVLASSLSACLRGEQQVCWPQFKVNTSAGLIHMYPLYSLRFSMRWRNWAAICLPSWEAIPWQAAKHRVRRGHLPVCSWDAPGPSARRPRAPRRRFLTYALWRKGVALPWSSSAPTFMTRRSHC